MLPILRLYFPGSWLAPLGMFLTIRYYIIILDTLSLLVLLFAACILIPYFHRNMVSEGMLGICPDMVFERIGIP